MDWRGDDDMNSGGLNESDTDEADGTDTDKVGALETRIAGVKNSGGSEEHTNTSSYFY